MPSSRGSSQPGDQIPALGLLHWQEGSFPLELSGKPICLDQFSSVIQLCLTLCDPMDTGFPIHHQLWELAQTHVH